MQLLLHAHISGRGVGNRLRGLGHDVLALDGIIELEGLDDDLVIEVAASQKRILITCDVADFPAILRDWAEAGRSHVGVILVYGIDHSEFDLLATGIQRLWKRGRHRLSGSTIRQY